MKIVSQLQDDLTGILSGFDLDQCTNLYGSLERAIRTMSQRAFVPEATGRQPYMLFDGVFNYEAPETIFGGTLNDLRPQGISRQPWDFVYKQPIELFDLTKALLPNGYQVTFEWNKGQPIMRVAQHRAQAHVLIDPMSQVSGWTAGGNATGLALDATVYYASPGALRFNISAAGDSYIEKTLESPLQITSYEGVASIFLAIDTPSADELTDITVRLGSDSSNYVEVAVSEGFMGPWTADEYLLVALDLSTATTTGTPDFDNIQYTRVTATTTAASS